MSSLASRSRSAAVALVVAVVLASACSGSSHVDGSGQGATGATSASAAKVPSPPSESAKGTGVIVVGGTSSRFAVTECRLDPNPADPAGARTLVAVNGAGTTRSDIAFTVELQRFATGTKVVTFTDTVTYADTARILQAQRIEVGGQITDLRDPKASTPLVRTRAGGVSARGVASAPGDGPDDGGIIGIAFDATC